MSDQVQCPKGHSYDRAMYSRCPQCPVPGLDYGPGGGRPGAAGNRTAESERPRPQQQPFSAPPNRSQPRDPKAHPRTIISLGMPKKARSDDASGKVAEEESLDPVVGWLVAVEGPNKGQDFRIRAGNNTIGRDPARHIYIPDDLKISRQTQAIITYDFESNTYYLSPWFGDKRGNIFVSPPRDSRMIEWEIVLQPREITSHSLIRLGDTWLVFVPLCEPDHFTWERGDETAASKDWS